MKTYAVRENLVPPKVIDTFRKMWNVFEELPDFEDPGEVSCHAVCRVMEVLFPEVKCVDGYFKSVGHDHSWMLFDSGHIADMYPIAGVNPFLVDVSSWIIPWYDLYIPVPDLLDTGNRDRSKHEDVAKRILSQHTGWSDFLFDYKLKGTSK